MPKARKTQRLKKSARSKRALKVDSPKKLPELARILKNGKINIVLIYADWCGACHRFMDNIWNPMNNISSRHNRIAVREDMIKNTSLANAKFKYLPSLIVVDERGEMAKFDTPEGNSNAMPTPKSLADMKKVANVPVAPLPLPVPVPLPLPEPQPQPLSPSPSPNSPTPLYSRTLPARNTPMPNIPEEVLTVNTLPSRTRISPGKSYVPTPMVAPSVKGRTRKRR